MREDLLKKFATAEGISGRLPYAILTKLYELVGWKRVECNKLFRFYEVTERDFESIVRRVAIVVIKARFFDRLYLETHFPRHQEYGVFCLSPM